VRDDGSAWHQSLSLKPGARRLFLPSCRRVRDIIRAQSENPRQAARTIFHQEDFNQMATELKRGGGLAQIEELLGEDGRALLEFNSPKVSKDALHVPGPDFVDRVWANSDRNPRVLRSLQTFFDNGRLAGTG
jgi:hypothetical protein